jgi:hypothetical protein
MIDLAALSLRDGILIAATLVGGYLLLLLLPLLRNGRKHRSPEAPGRYEDERAVRSEPVLSSEGQRREPRHGPSGLPSQDVSDELNRPLPPGFARELAQSSLDLEIRRLRRDMDAMRAELDSMAEELRQMKATRNVAPIYSEAMTLAQHGEAPAGIAAQCGISIGEAELVAALARSAKGDGFDDKDDERYRGAGR